MWQRFLRARPTREYVVGLSGGTSNSTSRTSSMIITTLLVHSRRKHHLPRIGPLPKGEPSWSVARSIGNLDRVRPVAGSRGRKAPKSLVFSKRRASKCRCSFTVPGPACGPTVVTDRLTDTTTPKTLHQSFTAVASILEPHVAKADLLTSCPPLDSDQSPACDPLRSLPWNSAANKG